MALPSREYGFRSARQILPLGVIFGVLLLSPLAWYLLSRDDIGQGDALVYVFASLSVLVAYLVFVLLFLWGADYADETEADGERPPPADR